MDNLVVSEIRITENSPLAHMSVEEVEKRFDVKILSISNPFPSITEQKTPKPDFRLYPTLYVEIKGKYDNIRNLRLEAVNY